MKDHGEQLGELDDADSDIEENSQEEVEQEEAGQGSEDEENDNAENSETDDGEPQQTASADADIEDSDWGRYRRWRSKWKPSYQQYSENPSKETFYQIFDAANDQEISANKLADANELEKLREYLDQQLDGLKGAVSRLVNKLQRRLQAKQNRTWKFDLEEGLLDAAKLSQ